MDSLLHLLAIIVVGGLWGYVTVAMLRSSESRTTSWTPDGTAGLDIQGFVPMNLEAAIIGHAALACTAAFVWTSDRS